MLQLRKEAGIQQNVLAKKIGISASALRAIESEKSLPKRSTINNFCQVLQIPRAELILRSLSWEDMPWRGEDRDDVLDIITLAIYRIKKSKARHPEMAKMELVNHPDHYKKDGKECIDVMLEDFGKDAVVAFCKLNAFKYRWRAGMKEGNSSEQDLAKAEWYENKADSLCSE